ncbi:hypothetical protein ACFFX0_20385 [Citricoccus parietis]|uniref:Uncharacterized protein n=1 Tax=Citricoccus parietis TaxID=592307 RepID=A0ABV5G3B3_9MICC
MTCRPSVRTASSRNQTSSSTTSSTPRSWSRPAPDPTSSSHANLDAGYDTDRTRQRLGTLGRNDGPRPEPTNNNQQTTTAAEIERNQP